MIQTVECVHKGKLRYTAAYPMAQRVIQLQIQLKITIFASPIVFANKNNFASTEETKRETHLSQT